MPDALVQNTLIRSLQDAKHFGADVEAVETIETHISWVLLAGEFAYKIKKSVKLPFLDFSTLAKRKHFCEEELRINRRLAPDIYLGLEPIGGTMNAPVLGARPAIEYAVKMRRFDPNATLERKLRRDDVSVESIRELAELVAKFHAAEPPAEGELAEHAVLDNVTQLGELLDEPQDERLEELRRWSEAQCKALHETLRLRRENGAIRECHGDLHLGNLVMIGKRIVPFDALEFNRSLRCIDVINEVSFLVMDLMAHGRSDFGFEFLNRYLERNGDYGGLRVVRFFLVYRALVRAKVHAIEAAQKTAEDARRRMLAGERQYLDLAGDLIHEQRPLLTITYGLSGSGKTTVSDALIGALPAVRIRSDLERKRLHGLAATARTHSGAGEGLYSEEETAMTYAALAEATACGLAAGLNVIVDAAFLSRGQRRAFHALARQNGASFSILELQATEDTLRRRIAARARRGTDASEAGNAVLDYQLAHREPLTQAEKAYRFAVDTDTATDFAGLADPLHRARQ